MDEASRHTIEALGALARASERLIELARLVSARPDATAVVQRVDLRYFEGSGPYLAMYVDAELNSGDAICWWLEVDWDEQQWTIETRILINRATERYQDELHRFPDRVADTLAGLGAALDAAVRDLMQAADEPRPEHATPPALST